MKVVLWVQGCKYIFLKEFGNIWHYQPWKSAFLWCLVHVTVNLQISLQIKLDKIMCGLCHLCFKIAVTGPNRREFIHSYNQKYLQVSQTTKNLYKIVLRINLLSLERLYSKFNQGLWNTCSGKLANSCVVRWTLYSLFIFLTDFFKRQRFKTLALIKLKTFRTVDKNPLRLAGNFFFFFFFFLPVCANIESSES